MKSLLMLLLMMGTASAFAQNLQISDFRQLMGIQTKDSVDAYLSSKGFSYGPGKIDVKKRGVQIGESWQFVSISKGETSVLSSINRWQDSAGNTISYETSNPYFYTSLLNQLGAEGFSYQQAIPDDSEAELRFSNGFETILVKLQVQTAPLRFQFKYKRADNNTAYIPRQKKTVTRKAVPGNRARKN